MISLSQPLSLPLSVATDRHSTTPDMFGIFCVCNMLYVLNIGQVVSARRGYARALGALPLHIVAQDTRILTSVFDALVTAARGGAGRQEPDAESRRQAILGLCELVVRVGLGEADVEDSKDSKDSTDAEGIDGTVDLPPQPQYASLTQGQVVSVLETLLDSLNDYATDDRGDVGSWVRRVAMSSLSTIITRVCLVGCVTIAEGGVDPLSAAVNPSSSSSSSGRGLRRGSKVDTKFGPGVLLRLRADGQTAEVGWAAPSLGAWYFPYGRATINVNGIAASDAGNDKCEEVVAPLAFDEEFAARIVSALLKQLAEKMDAVRHCAGETLMVRY